MAQNFPSLSQVPHGQPLYAILQPYSNLAAFGKQSTFNEKAVESIKNSLLAVYQRVSYILNSVNYAIAHLSEFNSNLNQLQTIQQQMTDIITNILKAREALSANPTANIQIPQLPDLSLLPSHISSSQRDVWFPPQVSFDAGYLQFQKMQNYIAKETTNFPQLHQDMANLLSDLQSKVLAVLGSANRFIENYIAAMEALQNSPSSVGDRIDISRNLSDIVDNGYYWVFSQFSNDITKKLQVLLTYYNDAAYDKPINHLNSFIGDIIPNTSQDKNAGGMLGGFWSQSKMLIDSINTVMQGWTSNNPLESMVNTNLITWKQYKINIDNACNQFGQLLFS